MGVLSREMSEMQPSVTSLGGGNQRILCSHHGQAVETVHAYTDGDTSWRVVFGPRLQEATVRGTGGQRMGIGEAGPGRQGEAQGQGKGQPFPASLQHQSSKQAHVLVHAAALHPHTGAPTQAETH